MGTKIEWANRPGTIGEVQNFVTGCTRISDGCTHCYIERQTPMRVAHRRFDRPGIGATLPLLLHRGRVDKPLHWRKPRTVFVNSMSDWMHRDVPRDLLYDAMAVWAVTPQHTYLTLTKRHDLLRSFLSDPKTEDAVRDRVGARWEATLEEPEWPLKNLWVGVSVENQKWAQPRLDALAGTPAAVRWVSAEPLLGPVDLSPWLSGDCPACGDDITTEPCNETHARMALDSSAKGLDWVVLGGESGPGARPMHPQWAREIRDACVAAGVPFYYKQDGAWAPAPWKPGKDPDETAAEWMKRCDQTAATHAYKYDADDYDWFTMELHPAWGGERADEEPGWPWAPIRRVGGHGGNLLDGRLWQQYPEAVGVSQ